MLSKIEIKQSETDLEMHNNATCNWVRDYSKLMEIELYCSNPEYIQISGYGNFTCADTIKSKKILVRQYGAGESNFLFDVQDLEVGFDSYGTMKASGSSEKGFYFTLSAGKLETHNLKTKILGLITQGDRDLHVWAEDSIYGEIRNNNKVFYRGNPKVKITAPNQNQLVQEN